MAKFHVNTDTGNSGKCRATTADGCPFDPENKGENHYDTLEEAQVAAEQKMKEQHGEVYKGFRKGERAGGDLSVHMKRRIIDEAVEGVRGADPAVIGRFLSQDKDENIRRNVAEKLNSQKLLRDMSDDESARVRKAIAQRTNNREVLAKLASDPDPKVRYAAIQNEKTPAKARKAAQAAIREANLQNLEKARAKTEATAKKQRANKVKADLKKSYGKISSVYRRRGDLNSAEFKALEQEHREAKDAAVREHYDLPDNWTPMDEGEGRGRLSYSIGSEEYEATPYEPNIYGPTDEMDPNPKLYLQTRESEEWSGGPRRYAGGPFDSVADLKKGLDRITNEPGYREQIDAEQLRSRKGSDNLSI